MWLGASEVTCAGYPASLGYETVDAQSFAEWGIDCMLFLFWFICLYDTEPLQTSNMTIAMSPVTGQTHMHTVFLMVTATTLMAPVLTSPIPLQKDMTGKRPRLISGLVQCAMPCSKLTAQSSIHFLNGARLMSRPGAMKLRTRGACLAISPVSSLPDIGVGGLVANSVFSGLGPYCANCQREQLLDGLRQFLELPRPGHVGDW